MAVTAQSAIQRVVDVLQDPSGTRWTIAELVRYYNDGRRQIILHRPDLAAADVTIALVAGARQALPATAAKLLDVRGNSGGSKLPVTMVSDRRLLDACDPGWRAAAGQETIVHVMYDEREARVFEVYPAAAVGASLATTCSVYPTDIAQPGEGATYADVAGNLDLSDICANAIVDYVLFRAYTKDAEFSPDPQRARQHLELFANALGVELQAVMASSPRSAAGT